MSGVTFAAAVRLERQELRSERRSAQPRVAWSRIVVALGAVGKSTDTEFGANFWSVRNNINFCNGSTYHIDAVQFTTQRIPNGAARCLDQIDVDTGDYATPKTCVNAKRPAGRNLQPGITRRSPAISTSARPATG